MWRYIEQPPRTKSGYRVFSPDVIQRIGFIKRSQELGFTLSEIGKLLNMTESENNYGCREVREFTCIKIHEIELKITRLSKY